MRLKRMKRWILELVYICGELVSIGAVTIQSAFSYMGHLQRAVFQMNIHTTYPIYLESSRLSEPL